MFPAAWLDGGGSAGVVEPTGAKEKDGLPAGVAAVAGAEDVGFCKKFEAPPPPKRFDDWPVGKEGAGLLGVAKPWKGAAVPCCWPADD